MTDCKMIYFPKGELVNIINSRKNGWLLHELAHTE